MSFRVFYLAVISIALLTSCAHVTYDARTCPAPLTAAGCAQHLGEAK